MRRLAVAFFAGSALVAACSSHGPQRVGQSPSWRRGWRAAAPRPLEIDGPVTFAPASEPAVRYNEPPPPVAHTALHDAAIAAVLEAAAQAGLPAPQPDARLFRACAELAEVVPEQGVISYALIEFALQRSGIIEPSQHLLVAWGDITSPDVIMRDLKPRIADVLGDGATARLGIGAARRRPDGTGVVVFALQGSGVSTLPIPRMIAAGASAELDAIVDPRYHDPEVFVTYQDGDTHQLEVKPGRPGGFLAQLACGAHRGRQQVEITASGTTGPTVLANFPVWCAAAPPRSVTLDPGHDDAPAASPDDAEHRLLGLVNRDRATAGLPPLLWDAQLAAVARGHSEEMLRTRLVAHVSPTTGSAADRVRAANLRPALVLENVARAYGIHEAHDGLMNSPGHRANLMSSLASEIGIGVAFGDEVAGRREMFITQVFARAVEDRPAPRDAAPGARSGTPGDRTARLERRAGDAAAGMPSGARRAPTSSPSSR